MNVITKSVQLPDAQMETGYGQEQGVPYHDCYSGGI